MPNVAQAGREPGEEHPVLKQCDELHDLGFKAGWNGAIEACSALMRRWRDDAAEFNDDRCRQQANLCQNAAVAISNLAAQPPAAPVETKTLPSQIAQRESTRRFVAEHSSAEQPKDEQTCHDCGAREPCDEDCPNHVEPEPVQSCSAGTAKALDDLEIFIGEVDGSEAAEGGTIDGTEAIEALNALRAAFAQPQGAQVTEVDIHGIIAEAMDGYGLTWKGIRRASRNILNRIGVSPQTVPMSEKPRPADCLDPTGCLWRHVPTSPDIGLHLCSRFGCPHTTSAVTRPEHRAPSASSPAEAAPSQRPPE
jgi:hypothetical protein